MINRYRGICKSCKQKFIFRVVVPLATTDGLRFCCPGCEIELSSGIAIDYSVPQMNLTPHGFSIDENVKSLTEPIVTIATDLPVHKTKHVNPLNEGGSPFIWLTQQMHPSFIEWKIKVELLQMLRHNHFSHARKLVNYTRSGNWKMAKKSLKFMSEDIVPDDDISTIYECYRAMGVLYTPLISKSEMDELLSEYYVFLNDCLDNKKVKYKALLEEWSSLTLFTGLRTKALNIYLRVLSNFDAFIVGHLYNEMPINMKNQIDDYQLFRDDYSIVKVLYQDLFELTSQLLIFLGSVINLSSRNAPWEYVTGVKTFNAFEKKMAFERFKILTELPKLSKIVGGVSRPMRNSIGHFSADYQVSTGQLIYDNGTKQNYIVFLGEFFAAVKALWFILIFIEKSDIDMTRLKVEIPVA